MGYRKEKSPWNNWVRKNSTILQEIGIPEKIYQSEQRWLVFLEHGGFDEYGMGEDHHNVWSISILNQKEKEKFYFFIKQEYPENYDYYLNNLKNEIEGLTKRYT